LTANGHLQDRRGRLKMFAKSIKVINQWMASLSVIIVFIMMVSITADVTLRYFANAPIVGVVELNRTLLVVVVFFTLGFAQVRKQHINVEMVLHMMSPRRKVVVEAIEALLALVIVGMITYGAVTEAYFSTVEGEHEVGLLNYPVWPSRIAMALGLFMLCMQYVVDILHGLVSYWSDKKAK
jgi:TRAP-type C4-dicarboxylate transport system permease small subunit